MAAAVIALGFVAVLFVACLAFSPTSAFSLVLAFSVSDSYEMSFSPQVLLQQVPRYMLALVSSYSVRSRPLAWGFNSLALDVNISALNVNGSLFFFGKFAFNTLALDKIQVYRSYDPALKSSNITLTVDALLNIDFENQTDVSREYHNSWPLQLP
jgi:hypothetical protein